MWASNLGLTRYWGVEVASASSSRPSIPTRRAARFIARSPTRGRRQWSLRASAPPRSSEPRSSVRCAGSSRAEYRPGIVRPPGPPIQQRM